MTSNGQNSDLLISIVRELSLARSRDAIMAIVRSAVRKLLGADGATFVLRDGDQCFYADEDAIGPLWKGQRFSMDICVSGWVMIHREQVAIEDIYADARIPADAYRATFVKSLAMVPIRMEAPIGAIGAYWAYRFKPSEAQISLLQTLADSASLALENLNLYTSLIQNKLELDRSNQAKDQFLAMVSHELRTPLNSIIGWIDLLEAGYLDPSEVRHAVETIQRNAKAQNRIVDDLFDMIEIMAGKVLITKEELDVVELVEDAVTNIRSRANAKELIIQCAFAPGVGSVLGDSLRLRRMLFHLLENSVKFTEQGGHIKVLVTREGPHVRIDIEDDGIGMEQDVIAHIFERFRQADSSRTRKHGGLGLGLAIALHIAQAHGGRIQATSAGQGKGAKFSTWLQLGAAVFPTNPP